MEWLQPVAEDEAVAFHRAIALRTPRVAELVDIVRRIHERARRELPWCGPLDHKPANVMRATDGRLVVADLFYADGPNLYATAATDPDLIVAKISQAERRLMTEIPWPPPDHGSQERKRRFASGSRRSTPARPGHNPVWRRPSARSRRQNNASTQCRSEESKVFRVR
jgi:hypothetical protein